MLIAGPTASGKSALALALAERDGGCVINADASQVYACWRILTARPDDADLARAPHRLYGHVGCAARYSVGAWLREVAAAISPTPSAAGQRPIVVGGTGLYLDASPRAWRDIPPIPAEVRARSRGLLRAGRIDVMLDDLARLDPDDARAHRPAQPDAGPAGLGGRSPPPAAACRSWQRATRRRRSLPSRRGRPHRA